MKTTMMNERIVASGMLGDSQVRDLTRCAGHAIVLCYWLTHPERPEHLVLWHHCEVLGWLPAALVDPAYMDAGVRLTSGQVNQMSGLRLVERIKLLSRIEREQDRAAELAARTQ